jgi:hypothetical protein
MILEKTNDKLNFLFLYLDISKIEYKKKLINILIG